MSSLQATINAPYPNRIQLTSVQPLPLMSPGALGSFDPRRDVQVYVNGAVVAIQTFDLDLLNNRYLLYTGTNFNPNPNTLVQVTHAMPSPPFKYQSGNGAILPGFSIIADYSAASDTTAPTAVLTAFPSTANPSTPIQFFWNATNVDSVRITAGGLDTGIISTTGIGSYYFADGFAVTTSVLLTGYKNTISVCSSSTTVTIANLSAFGFGAAFGAAFGS
jgi:hypothetical protein